MPSTKRLKAENGEETLKEKKNTGHWGKNGTFYASELQQRFRDCIHNEFTTPC